MMEPFFTAEPNHGMKGRAVRNEIYAWLPTLIVILTVVAVAVAALALHNLETELVAFAGESLALAAIDLADKIDLALFEQYSDVQVLAGTLDSHMHDHRELAKHLSSWQQVHQGYLWMGVADLSGRIVAATDLAQVGQDVKDSHWFPWVKEHLDVYVEDAAKSQETGAVVAISFAAPIRNGDGHFLGAVLTRVGLPALEGVFGRPIRVLQMDKGITGPVEWQLISRKGEVLYNSQSGRPGRENLIQMAQPSALLLSATGHPGYIEEPHAIRRTRVLTGYAHTEGYGRFNGLQWGVLVHLPRREVLLPVVSLLGQVGSAGVAAVIPLLVLLFWTALRLRKEWSGLQEREARLATTLASTTDAVIVTDGAGRISSMNQVAQDLTGWAQEAAQGKKLEHLVTLRQARSERATETPVAAVLENGTPAPLPPLVLVERSGRERDVEGSVSPIREDSGRIIGALVVLRDITERMKAERRRHAQYAVTKVLAEAATLDEALPLLLEAICNSLDWSVGLMFAVDETTQQLELVEFWHTETDTVPAFGTSPAGAASGGGEPGFGLPGRVLAEKKPVWISDVARDKNLPGAPLAAKARLRGAFAFPILSGDKVLGILEFFSHGVRQPDHDLLQMLGAIGSQVGQYMERRQLERQVRQGPAGGAA